MNQIALRLSAAALLVCVGISQARADDTTTCFSSNSENYKLKEYFEPAMQACSRLIASRTGTSKAAAYRARGYWKHMQRNLDAAIADFNIAIGLDPRHIEGYNYRADVWRDLGNLDRALADYDMATRIDPTFAAAYFNRGRVYEMQGDTARARQEYHAALAVPAKDRLGEWAHREASARLSRLGQ